MSVELPRDPTGRGGGEMAVDIRGVRFPYSVYTYPFFFFEWSLGEFSESFLESGGVDK